MLDFNRRTYISLAHVHILLMGGDFWFLGGPSLRIWSPDLAEVSQSFEGRPGWMCAQPSGTNEIRRQLHNLEPWNSNFKVPMLQVFHDYHIAFIWELGWGWGSALGIGGGRLRTIYTNLISHCVNARTPIEKDKRSTIGERHPLLLRFELVKG